MEQCVALQRKAVALVLEEHARLHPTLALSVDELRAISSPQFEDEIARMFTRLGYEVKQTSYSNDRGRDAIMMKDGNKYLVECKRYAKGGLSGRPALQKFYSAIMTDNATSGFFVTTGGFSDPAVRFATENKIELIDATALVRLMLESRSNSATANSAEYSSACHFCVDIVSHNLRAPHSVTCQNGHEVKPSLDIETVLKSHHPWDMNGTVYMSEMGRSRGRQVARTQASGSNLTFESEEGFPPDSSHASLAHAHRNFHHTQAR